LRPGTGCHGTFGAARRRAVALSFQACLAEWIFASYDCPGNVRDLENVIAGAIALGTSAYIGQEDLAVLLTGNTRPHAKFGSWVTELNASKKAIIERTLQKTGGNRAEATRLLDLNPKYFSALCKELNVNAKPE